MDHSSEGDLPGELFENTDYCQPFQCSPTACVACYFMTHGEKSHSVRYVSAHSIGLTGSEHVCEVCQKLTCLPIDQPPPVGKELSMTDSTSANVPTNLQRPAHTPLNGSLNRSYDEGLPVEFPGLSTNLESYEALQMHSQYFMPAAAEQFKAHRPQSVPQQPVLQQPVLQPLGSVPRHTFEVVQLEKGLREHQLKNRPGGRTAEPVNRRVVRPAAEPALVASTYVVPTRSQPAVLNAMASSIPFAVLLVLFAMSLAAAVALASPSVALWIGVSELIITLIRALFVTVVFSVVIAFILELTH